MSDKPTYYTLLPAKIRYDKRLSPMARIIFTDLMFLSNNEDGYSFAGNGTIAKWYGVDRKTISRCIRKLEKCNYIKVKRIKDGMINRNNLITILWKNCGNVEIFKKYVPKMPQVWQKCPEGVAKMSQGCGKNVPHNNTSRIIQDNSRDPNTQNQNQKPEKYYAQNATHLLEAIKEEEEWERKNNSKSS